MIRLVRFFCKTSGFLGHFPSLRLLLGDLKQFWGTVIVGFSQHLLFIQVGLGSSYFGLMVPRYFFD